MSYPPPPGQSPYPSVPPPPPPGSGKLRGGTPRKLGWIFLIVAVALFVAGGIVIAKKSYSKVNDFQRITIADGTGTVNLDRTGKWVAYYEASNVSSSIDRIPNVNLAVTDASGTAVTLESYGNRSDNKVDKLTYDYNGHKGIAAAQFTITAKGTYQVRVEAVDTLPAGAQIAFGEDIATSTIVGGLLVVGGVLFLIAAIVLLIVGYVKRSRAKKERARYGAGGGYGPPPGYGYGPPPAYGGQTG